MKWKKSLRLGTKLQNWKQLIFQKWENFNWEQHFQSDETKVSNIGNKTSEVN